MLLIIFLGIIAKLALVSGNCDVGTQDVKDFDFIKATGTWYVLEHTPDDIEDEIDCINVTYALPVGNMSLITVEAYDYSANSSVTIYGNATNWNTTGYLDEIFSPTYPWTGRYYIIATDYKSYVILKLCPSQSNELHTYVAYRSKHPKEETVEDVKKELQKNKINVTELQEWPADNCQ